MRVVALLCAAFLLWGVAVADGPGPGGDRGRHGEADKQAEGGGHGIGREVSSVTVVGGPRNVTDWLPLVPLHGGALDGDRVVLSIDESPAVTESWGYDENDQLVQLYLASYELAVGPGFEGRLAVADDGGSGYFFGPGERDYELTIVFHADGTATVRLDAPTW